LAASVSGLTGAISNGFNITPSSPANIVATSGSGQSTLVSTSFSSPLRASLFDSFGNPINGASVTFTAPASGASGTFAGGGTTATVTTGTQGVDGLATSPTFTANSVPNTSGTHYNVTANYNPPGGSPATFALTNTACGGSVVTNSNDNGAGSLRDVIF